MFIRWAILTVVLSPGFKAGAQVTFTNIAVADVFMATGSVSNLAGSDLTGNNYGGAGTLVIAPVSEPKGEFRSALRFNMADPIPLFNSTYGTNGWEITGIAFDFASNFGTAGNQPLNPIFGSIKGGQFAVEWLSNDAWLEGTGNPNAPTTDGVTYNSITNDLLSGAHEILCTNTYTPPGNNVHVIYPLPLSSNLVADVKSGGDVSFYFYAVDNQINYLFNSRTFGQGNQPRIAITAAPLLKILSGSFTNHLFHLTAAGAVDGTYQVQASTNLILTNWQTLGTVTGDNIGALKFDDVTATNFMQRFYRLLR